jgi:hypothetical protein
MQFILDYFWVDLVLLAFAIAAVYFSLQVHSVPALRTISAKPPLRQDDEMRDLGFTHVGSFDASSNPALQLHVWVYLSADRQTMAVVVNLSTIEDLIRTVEFHSDLSPSGNISTGNSKHAGTFYYPPHKTVVKAPWKKGLLDLFNLHKSLCETAWQNGFQPVTIQADRVRESILNDMRGDYEYQVRSGRMIRISEDKYRLSLKGAIISVPLVWSRMVHTFAYELYRPSNAAHCRRLGRRLRRARLSREP